MRRSLTRLVLAVLPLGLFGAHLSGSRVAPMAQRSSVHSQQLQFISVSFADSRNGWVAAFTPDQNYTLHTTNSGHTWARYPVAFEARQMQFIDARRGWAIGFAPRNCSGPRTPCGGVIAATLDGGQSWAWQGRFPRCWQPTSLDFANSADGWAVEGNGRCLTRPSQQPVSRLVRTVDSGRTWRVVLTAPGGSGSVHFGDPLHGWFATGGFGTSDCSTTVIHTVDGGKTWTPQFRVGGYCAASVDFVNDDNGWLLATKLGMCSMGGCYDNRLYHSQDGGRHWNQEQPARLPGSRMPALWSGRSGFLGSVVFVSPQIGYIPVSEGAGPGQGGIDITRDGGRHWVRKLPYGLQVGSISPIDAVHAWAVGVRQGGCRLGAVCSILLSSSNTGRNWHIIHTS